MASPCSLVARGLASPGAGQIAQFGFSPGRTAAFGLADVQYMDSSNSKCWYEPGASFVPIIAGHSVTPITCSLSIHWETTDIVCPDVTSLPTGTYSVSHTSVNPSCTPPATTIFEIIPYSASPSSSASTSTITKTVVTGTSTRPGTTITTTVSGSYCSSTSTVVTTRTITPTTSPTTSPTAKTNTTPAWTWSSSSTGSTTKATPTSSSTGSTTTTSPTSSSSSGTTTTSPTTTPTPALRCPGANMTTYTTSKGSFLIECYIDHFNYGINGPMYDYSYAGCIILCANTPGCVALSYVPNGPCYLKNGIGAGRADNGIWGAALYNVTSSTTTSSSSTTSKSSSSAVSTTSSTSTTSSGSTSSTISTTSPSTTFTTSTTSTSTNSTTSGPTTSSWTEADMK